MTTSIRTLYLRLFPSYQSACNVKETRPYTMVHTVHTDNSFSPVSLTKGTKNRPWNSLLVVKGRESGWINSSVSLKELTGHCP